jgi:hypothetical protein
MHWSQHAAIGKRGLAQAPGQGRHQQGGCAKDYQGLLPAELADQEAFRRHHQELPERAGRGGDAHGPGASLGRHIAPDHPVDDRIGGAGLGDADQHARAQRKRQRGGRMGHAEQARGIEQGAGDDHAKGPETVRHHAREDAGRAPCDVLDRDRKGKGLTRPSWACVMVAARAKPWRMPMAQGDDGAPQAVPA